MAFDALVNFGYAVVTSASGGGGTPTTYTTIVVTGFASLPAVPFNVVLGPGNSTEATLATASEIIRVTANASGSLTVVRAQESTSAVSVAAGFTLKAAATKKTFTDMQTLLAPLANPTFTGTVSLDSGGLQFTANGMVIDYYNANNIRMSKGLMIDGSSGGYAIYFGGLADTNLYRNSATVLKTDGSLQLGGNLIPNGFLAAGGIAIGSNGVTGQTYIGLKSGLSSLVLGTGEDAYIQRAGSRSIQSQSSYTIFRATPGTDPALMTAGDSDNFDRYILRTDGAEGWGSGAAAVDLYQYRGNPGQAIFYASTSTDISVVLYPGVSGKKSTIDLYTGDWTPAVQLVGRNGATSGADFVVRTLNSAASGLQDSFTVFGKTNAGSASLAGALTIGGSAGVVWTGGTNLYAAGSGLLKTDGGIYAVGGMVSAWTGSAWGVGTGVTGSSGYVEFNGDSTAMLYSPATGFIRTTLHLQATGAINLDLSGGGSRLAFGATGDACFSRSAANQLDCSNGSFGTLRAAAFTVSSDRELKSDIQPVDDASYLVSSILRAKLYTYNRDGDTKNRHIGLMADELPQDILVEGPHPSKKKKTVSSIDLYKAYTAAVATIQHLNERIEKLENAA